jgi:hypothetical protein
VASGERHPVDFEPCPVHQGYRATAVTQLHPSVTSTTDVAPAASVRAGIGQVGFR